MRQHSSRLSVFCVVLAMLLSSIMAAAGCGSRDKTAEDLPIVMMLPKGADHFIIIDVQTLRTDDDLGDVYEGLGLADDLDGYQLLGISADDIDYFATSGDTVVLEGHFDLDAVRDVMEDHDFDKDQYRGVETWEESITDGIALISDSCVIVRTDGNINECIDVVKGQGEALYDDDSLAETFDRLPSGLVVMYGVGTQGFATGEDYEGLEATGMSIGKKDVDNLWIFAVLRFGDEATAQDAASEIGEVSPEGFSNTKVTQDGRYLKVAADVHTDYFPPS